MSKHKDPLVAALERGESFTYTLPDGGDFHSMRLAFSFAQTVTISPVSDPGEIVAGDIVFIKWRGGGYILHPVKEVQGDRLLIINSMGKENGWAAASDVLGKVTRIENPPMLQPSVPEMLALLQETCAALAAANEPAAALINGVARDFDWYAAEVGEDRWERLPNDRGWSFASHLWHILKEAMLAQSAPGEEALRRWLHHARQHIGFMAGDLLPPEE